MKLKTLDQLLQRQLETLYGTEKECRKTFPKLSKAADDKRLREVFDAEIKTAEKHIERLDEIFTTLKTKPATMSAHRIAGLFDDCLDAAKEECEPHVHDAALIAVAQHVDHDEIAGYGCARTWAKQLGYTKVADLLQKTLDEEKASDRQFSELAEKINPTAVAARTPATAR